MNNENIIVEISDKTVLSEEQQTIREKLFLARILNSLNHDDAIDCLYDIIHAACQRGDDFRLDSLIDKTIQNYAQLKEQQTGVKIQWIDPSILKTTDTLTVSEE